MANKNWQSFLLGTVASIVGYTAQKLAEPNTASWVETRNQIYSNGLQAVAQELADRGGKLQTEAVLPEKQNTLAMVNDSMQR